MAEGLSNEGGELMLPDLVPMTEPAAALLSGVMAKLEARLAAGEGGFVIGDPLLDGQDVRGALAAEVPPMVQPRARAWDIARRVSALQVASVARALRGDRTTVAQARQKILAVFGHEEPEPKRPAEPKDPTGQLTRERQVDPDTDDPDDEDPGWGEFRQP